jgi:hypothetical protein
MRFLVNINTRRGGLASQDEAFRRAEARKHVRLFLAPKDADQLIADSMVPDYLVTESMLDRFLAINPPNLLIISPFDPIIEEIEHTYVLGLLFAALSAAVVTIERALNDARIRLHQRVSPKFKDLWDKGALNEWERNIIALETWKYLPVGLAQELREVYTIRCRYLHSGEIAGLEGDSLRAVNAAYELLRSLLGFPRNLFEIDACIRCLDEQDPLFKAYDEQHLDRS